ncbi:hypothetical protein NSA42_17580 [Paeniclostridium sordellii]|uniref:hypothetical protein n=1 Tax=Paraclostridium sordellii TaxID=1505 RepID=UPI002149B91E|nr:hypothetical protein [Paeniclostridium sordellii]MCR1851088.1 hypothetical protein [Paeniclostridium sordellii]
MVNEEIIKNWGIPESIKDKNIEFIFDINNLNSETIKDKVIEGLYCNSGGSKFCLYDIEGDKIIFTMDFFILGTDYRLYQDREKIIKLECLCTNDFEARKKGISGYYLEKVIEFGISNNINKFKLIPNPDDELFENLDKRDTLSPKDLKNWYIREFKKFGFKSNNLPSENNKLSQIIFEK